METTDRLIRRIRTPLGRLRRGLLGVVESGLHPYRRRRALLRLDGLDSSVSRMLFICLGNKCRSPYAEARVRARLGAHRHGVEVASAGLLPGGRTPPEEAVAVAAERSLDLSGHSSRAVTPAMLEAVDLVVVMEPGQVTRLPLGGAEGPATLVLGDLDPEPVRRRGIRDPWGQDRATFRAVFDRIDRCTDVLLDALRPAEPGSARPEPDPTPSARDAPSTAGR